MLNTHCALRVQTATNLSRMAARRRAATADEKSRSSDGATRSTVAHSQGFGVPDPRSLPKPNTREPQVLAGEKDRYGSITVTLRGEAAAKTAPVRFKQSIKASLDLWEREGIRGVWLTIPTAGARLVPVAVDAGFEYHHAKPGLCVLTKWLPKEEPSRLPLPPHHQAAPCSFSSHLTCSAVLVLRIIVCL